MAFDALAAGLGELFGLGTFDAAAAAAGEFGAGLAADVGLGAAEAAPAVADIAGLGAADLGAAGAADLGAAGAADLGAGALDLGATGAGFDAAQAAAGGFGADLGGAATDLAGTATGTAADIGGAAADFGGVAPGVADTLASAVPGAEFSTLGTNVGGALPSNALALADTGAVTPGAAEAAAAPAAGSGGVANLPGTSLNAATDIAEGVDPNVQAALGNPTGNPGSEVAASSLTPSGTAPGGGQVPDMVTAAQAGGASAAAPASSDLTSSVGSALNSPWTKAAELALPLGFLGYNLAKGPGGIPPQAQQAVSNAQATAPALTSAATANVPLYNQTAATDLNLANNFQISPAQAASIDTWKNNQYNQLRQQIANQGITDVNSSSEWVQGKNQIDQQALSQQTQMVSQLITTAFQASSAANAGVSTGANVTSQMDATLMQAANLQVQQDAAFNQAVGSSLQSFGLLAALSGKFGGSNAAATP